jgi:hypothetical protein
MTEKREFTRYSCNLPVKFIYFEGNPDEFEIETAKREKGKGVIVDISQGGVFIISNSRVNMNLPINLKFVLKKDKFDINGIIVRTGLIKNNPSEVAQKYAEKKLKGDAYIAVKFDSILTDIEI